jgi:hypothetical protein
MLRMCVYMHPRFVENHPIRILKDGPLISEVVLSQLFPAICNEVKTFNEITINLPAEKGVVSSYMFWSFALVTVFVLVSVMVLFLVQVH